MLARLGAIDNSVARLALQLDVVQRSASRSPEGLPTARRSDFTTRLSECTAASRKDTRTETSKARRARKTRSARTMDALRQGGDELARHIAALEDTLALRRRQEVAVKAARSIEAWWWAEIERWKAAGRKHRHARSIVREAMRRALDHKHRVRATCKVQRLWRRALVNKEQRRLIAIVKIALFVQKGLRGVVR